MEIHTEVMAGGVRIVKPVGKLDVFTFTQLKKYFEELYQQASSSSLQVIVDLSAVVYIASSGWSVLLSRRQALRRAGGDMSIFGLSEDIRRVYESMRISKMLPAAGSAAEAASILDHGSPA